MVPPGGMRFPATHAIIITMKHIFMLAEEGVFNRRERRDRRDWGPAAPGMSATLSFEFYLSAIALATADAFFAVKPSPFSQLPPVQTGFLQNEPILPRGTKDHFPKRTHFQWSPLSDTPTRRHSPFPVTPHSLTFSFQAEI